MNDFDDLQKRGASALLILETAETYFGRFGLEGVSLRKIAAAAGMANNSAVAYHFGDRDTLIRSILLWRQPSLEAVGGRLLVEAEAESRLNDPATLMGIILRPHLSIVNEEDRHPHATFMNQLMRSPGGRAIRYEIDAGFASAARAISLLAPALPGLPLPQIYFRLRLAVAAFFDAIVELDRRTEGEMGWNASGDELIEVATAIMRQGSLS